MSDAQQNATSPPHTATPFEPLTERDLAYAIAEAVANCRNSNGWSQRELAEAAGMKQPHISLLESANRLPTLNVLLRIANAMGAKLVVTLEKDQETP